MFTNNYQNGNLQLIHPAPKVYCQLREGEIPVLHRMRPAFIRLCARPAGWPGS
jgi:hypothetical protein